MFTSQNPQQERGGALLSVCAPGEYLTWYGVPVLNVHLMELSCLLVGETSRLGVVLGEWDGSDSPNS